MRERPSEPDNFSAVARSAVDLAEVVSVAIFAVDSGSSDLVLAAAEGVEGPPLDRLIAAVRDPAHPIARTASDATASFDATPMAPGGPALRSHVPLLVEEDGRMVAVGVIAVAHDARLGATSRAALIELAARAAAIGPTPRPAPD